MSSSPEEMPTLAKRWRLTETELETIARAAGGRGTKDAAEIVAFLAPDRASSWRELAAVERARGNVVIAEAYEEVAQCLA